MAKALSFDRMEYHGVGNEVVCTVNVSEDATSRSESKEMVSTAMDDT